jgi:hypothetical protein
MNRIHCIRRLAGVLAGLAGTLLTSVAAAPAALAVHVPPPGGSAGTPAPSDPATVVAGGMPGWQITLIAVGAALLAATAAVILDRARATHRKTTTAPA